MRYSIKQQQGAVLFISLIFLVLLTILGLSSMRTTLLQEKMAGNFKNKSQSFQAAETALRAGEQWLSAQANIPFNGDRVYATITTDKTWWSSKGIEVAMDGVSVNPRYAIERKDKSDQNDGGEITHRIFAYGLSGTSTTVLLLNYNKRYN
ncbi:MAG: PilX N-terminal domain-containing pilus assembly protein [Pseudomonadota bacterium]